MSYETLLHDGIIRRHRFSPAELRLHVGEMLVVIDRHLQDANARGLSFDAHYSFAYAAARVAAEITMYSEGFRTGTAIGNHAAVFMFLNEVGNGRWATEAQMFDRARQKRNVIEYHRAGIATDAEVQELTEAVTDFVSCVRDWLRSLHPELVPDSPPAPEHQ